MRFALAAAASAVLLFGATACQDQQARDTNAKLQAELDVMKAQQAKGGQNDLLAVMLANQNKSDDGTLDKKVNSLGEDVRAGLDDIKKKISESDRTNVTRLDDLETRLKKVADMESSIKALSNMIETLEKKVKDVDPNQVLTLQKDLITRDADLKLEQSARANAEAEIARLKTELTNTKAEVDLLKEQMSGLVGSDISKHPMFLEQRKKTRDVEQERDKARSDFDNMKAMYEDLVKRKGGEGPKVEEPDRSSENFIFSGTVLSVTKTRADSQSILLVEVKKGTVPALNDILIVLDARNNEVCRVKVIRHYHVANDTSLPVENLGCQTVNETGTRPVAKGDDVVQLKKKDTAEEPKGAAGGN